MKKIKEELKRKIKEGQDDEISEESIGKIIKRRKNWTTPGIDGIKNFWWKRLSGTWHALGRPMRKWMDDLDSIPEWLTLGRIVLLPKTENLSAKKNYRPVTCLNTSYKLFTGIMGRYIKDHAIRNNIWNERQLGATVGVLDTVDQLLIDKYIMDEVREHKSDLAVAFYDYEKAYNKVCHD